MSYHSKSALCFESHFKIGMWQTDTRDLAKFVPCHILLRCSFTCRLFLGNRLSGLQLSGSLASKPEATVGVVDQVLFDQIAQRSLSKLSDFTLQGKGGQNEVSKMGQKPIWL